MKLEVYTQTPELTTLALLRLEPVEAVASLEVYDEGKEVYASAGPNTRTSVKHAARIERKARTVERLFDDYDAEPDEHKLRELRNRVAELRYALNHRDEPVAANAA